MRLDRHRSVVEVVHDRERPSGPQGIGDARHDRARFVKEAEQPTREGAVDFLDRREIPDVLPPSLDIRRLAKRNFPMQGRDHRL